MVPFLRPSADEEDDDDDDDEFNTQLVKLPTSGFRSQPFILTASMSALCVLSRTIE